MITIIIIAITAFVSISAFSNSALIDRFIFYPPAIQNKQWYRFLSYGIIHADWSHLIFNMLALYMFGTKIEEVFVDVLGTPIGATLYLVLYLSALIASILPSYYKEKNNSYYRSLGASGAVSAIVFAYIMVYPMSYMGLMFIPIFLPAFIFGFIYVFVSIYLDRSQSGNINHMAHVAGGIYGIVFLYFSFIFTTDINIFKWFVENIQINSFRDLIRFGY